jgi:hypothetical protein
MGVDGDDGRTVIKMTMVMAFDVRCPVLRRRPGEAAGIPRQ